MTAEVDLTFIKLVRTWAVDLAEGFGEVVGWGFDGGQSPSSGLDRDGAVAACGAHEFLDAPAGLGPIQWLTARAANTIVR
jgi:hypothetical protein